MPPKRKSARQAGRSAAKITKRAIPSSGASSDLAEVSAAQQTAELVNIVDLTSVVTLVVTEALKAVGVGQTTPLSSPPTVNPSPGSVDASATVETATAAGIACISSLSAGRQIQTSGATRGRSTHPGSEQPTTTELEANLKRLMHSAISPGSRKTYEQAWNHFLDFPPDTVAQLCHSFH